ncbi:MmcQ/YjbR family DNA-binding protein [Flavobacterium crassostreae]|uniref:MmcQ-like protein n=1 Tax=Flavobacterium crassostreae TaxID=1763534 RepID=A0A1B9E958_9FLAO|nr:hypothetical protein LPBF_02140 [Flavobacterium crassostreae]
MDLENYYNYCLSKKGVTADFPFGVHTLVFKVGSKMVALTSLPLWEAGTPKLPKKQQATIG